jgi:ADP-ribosylglycohydrolase
VRCQGDADQERTTKVGVQRDAAECLLQLSLYGPGRDMLAGQASVLRALHALDDGQALSEEAQASANGALMAVEGRSPEPEPEGEGEDAPKHVMVSCRYTSNHYWINQVPEWVFSDCL